VEAPVLAVPHHVGEVAHAVANVGKVVAYEDYEGQKLERKMLELLRSH
jgi:hypothetical protein